MISSGTPQGDSHAVAPRPYRMLWRLTWLYGAGVLVVGAFLMLALLPPGWMAGVRAVAAEAATGGLGAIVESTLLLALTAVAGALAMAAARHRQTLLSAQSTDGAPGGWLLSMLDPGGMARVGQAVIVPTGAVLVVLAAALMWPRAVAKISVTSVGFAAAYVFALTFICLVAERTMAAFPAPQLKEAPALRRVLLVATVLLLAGACLELVRETSLSWLTWVVKAVTLVPCVIASEMAVRALGRLFLPAPPADSATAVSSGLAGLLTGVPRSPSYFLRTQLGLDFARSWALSYLSAAIVPAITGTALFCWSLSGVKLINLGSRGVYERFGAPVAVLGPGLHFLLPWPLGRLRPVELGEIHSVAIGVDQNEPAEPLIPAEAPAPLFLNRMWESAHAGQAHYIVPSLSMGREGFQSVSTEISVLYRVGLTDAQALDFVYTVAKPQDLVKEAASRIVLRYFNSRTLDTVLGANREKIEDSLRAALVANLNAYHAGIDVVAVLIEEIHPPAGAAAAYHAVQAAQINASASIFNELGRAKRVAGMAQEEAYHLVAAANATAAETLDAARADAVRFAADRKAYAVGGRAFLLERSFSDIEQALEHSSLTLVDHRLDGAQAPVLDLRPGASFVPPNPNGSTDEGVYAVPSPVGSSVPGIE